MRSSSYRQNPKGTEHRLGVYRPSLESMRTTTSMPSRQGQGHQSEAETDYDSYNDDDDNELEAYLSRQHGEAAEASGKKKRTSDQDIAKEYADQQKQQTKKPRRNVHRTVTPDDLVKSKGLTVVRNGIAPRFQQQKYQKTPRSMAKFSCKLLGAYGDWMETMTNGLPLRETMWKLRLLSSKTQVKQYLGDLRKTVRDDHVERLLGLEKAETVLRQLDDYYAMEQQHTMEDDDAPVDETAYEEYRRELDGMQDNNENDNNNDQPTTTAPRATPFVKPMANPYATKTTTAAASPTANTTATEANTAVTPEEPAAAAPQDDNDNDDEDPLLRRLQLQKEHRRKHVLEDSDDDEDEDEADFSDVVAATNKETPKTARKHVLEDDSDDDDELEFANSLANSKKLEDKFESVKALLETDADDDDDSEKANATKEEPRPTEEVDESKDGSEERDSEGPTNGQEKDTERSIPCATGEGDESKDREGATDGQEKDMEEEPSIPATGEADESKDREEATNDKEKEMEEEPSIPATGEGDESKDTAFDEEDKE